MPIDIVVSRAVPDTITVEKHALKLAAYRNTTVGLEYEFSNIRVRTEQQFVFKSSLNVGPPENRLPLLGVTRDMGTEEYTLELITGAVEVDELPGKAFEYMAALFEALNELWEGSNSSFGASEVNALDLIQKLNGDKEPKPWLAIGSKELQKKRTLAGSKNQVSSPQVNVGVTLSALGVANGRTYEYLKGVFSGSAYEQAVGAVKKFILEVPGAEQWASDAILRGVLVTYAVMTYVIGNYLQKELKGVTIAPNGEDRLGCQAAAGAVEKLDSKSVPYKESWGALIKARPAHLWHFVPDAAGKFLRDDFLKAPKAFAEKFVKQMLPNGHDGNVKTFMGLAFMTMAGGLKSEWARWSPAPKPIDVFLIGDYPAMVVEQRGHAKELEMRDGVLQTPELAALYLKSLSMHADSEEAIKASKMVAKQESAIVVKQNPFLTSKDLSKQRKIAFGDSDSDEEDDNNDDSWLG